MQLFPKLCRRLYIKDRSVALYIVTNKYSRFRITLILSCSPSFVLPHVAEMYRILGLRWQVLLPTILLLLCCSLPSSGQFYENSSQFKDLYGERQNFLLEDIYVHPFVAFQYNPESLVLFDLQSRKDVRHPE